MTGYLVRLFVCSITLGLICVLTGTLAWWPAYAVGALVLSFVPGAVLIEIVPDVLEALADADWDFH